MNSETQGGGAGSVPLSGFCVGGSVKKKPKLCFVSEKLRIWRGKIVSQSVKGGPILCHPKAFQVHFLPSTFLLAVVRHITNVHENAATHSAEDYINRVSGENQTQFYPNFPLLRERAIYKMDCKAEDKKQSKDSCQKDFPAHSKLTPGLYLLTCGCPNKSVYGFSMMTTGESPAMLFDLVMTRFETNYNPHIIYDASCLAKEYGYNRELRRFMSLTITTDRFHQCNHKSCSDSFRSTEYSSLENINTEACEQTNSALRRVSSSTTYMSPIMYMRSLTLFLADLNVSAKRKS